jgi:hypothetical protein
MTGASRMTDIFEFWSQIKRGARVHPADVKAFQRMDAARHGFQLDYPAVSLES